MTLTVGQQIIWHRPNGRIVKMTVDLIHESHGEVWIFGAPHKDGSWTAVNQALVEIST